MPSGVRKAYAFLVVSFALPLNPSTVPAEMPLKARAGESGTGVDFADGGRRRAGHFPEPRKRRRRIATFDVGVACLGKPDSMEAGAACDDTTNF